MPPALTADAVCGSAPGHPSSVRTPFMHIAASAKTTREFCYTGRSPLILAGVIVGHVLLLASLTHPVTHRVDPPPKTLAVRLIMPATQAPKPLRLPPKTVPPAPSSRPLKKSPDVIVTTSAPSARRTLPPAERVAEPFPDDAAPAVPAPELAQTVSPPIPTPPAEVELPPVVPPRYNADYLDNPEPPYPVLSQRLKEEGEVRLRVWVDAAGAPSRVALYRSSGFERLDRIALETVQRWRFTPARQGDQAIAAQVIVPLTFNLKD